GVGALAGAAPHIEVLAHLSPLRSRRLRGWEAQRVSGSHRYRCSLRCREVPARGNGVSTPRIAIIRQKYNPSGGAERFVVRAIDALQGAGQVEVHLFARSWKDTPGLRFIRLDPFHVGRTWRDWSFARAACRHLRGTSYDLVQS